MHQQTVLHDTRFADTVRFVSGIQQQISATAASVLILQNGRPVHEWYSGRHSADPHSRPVDARSQFNVGSVRKTYLGLAISLALHEGKIRRLDDWITDYLPDLDETVLAGTTIRHLLTHTHGLQRPLKRLFPAGMDWTYNNAGVNLLIRLVQQVFEQPLAQVIRERVLQPCGFAETGWRQHSSEELVWVDEAYAGEQGGEANLFVSTRELAFWGQLHLDRGNWEGRQILPGHVFEMAVSVATPSALEETLPRNGFFWWVQDRPRALSELGDRLPLGSFQSLGIFGNAVLVIPEYRVVAVRMLNQTEKNPPGYDYLEDIKTFGNLVAEGACS